MDNETNETETPTANKPLVSIERIKKDKDNGTKESKAKVEAVEFQYVATDKIVVEPGANPRKIFDREYLKELADSIRQEGIINPLTVNLQGGKYILVAGECRLRAAKIVGLATVPVRVKTSDAVGYDITRLIENAQRRDLRPMEEALSYKKLLGKTIMVTDGSKQTVPVLLNVKNLAKTVSKSGGHISQRLALLELHRDIQQALIKDEITVSQARELHAAGDEKLQLKLLAKIRGTGDTVRVDDLKSDIAKARAQRRMAEGDTSSKPARGRPPREEGTAPNVSRQGLEKALEHLKHVKLEPKKATDLRVGMATIYEKYDGAKSDEKKMYYKGAIAALEWATGLKEDF